MIQPLVSVIIPTHNRKDMVVRLLRSVFASTYKTIEVLVVDDASSDGTSQAVKKIFPGNTKLHVVRNNINLYSAGSRNRGMKLAKGKYLFFIDDDNVVDKYAIAELVREFEKDNAIGELGLAIYSFNDKHKVLWLRTKRNMWTSKTYRATDIREFSHEKTWDTADVPNAFMVRASVIKQHHLSFCKQFGIMYEESDLAYRIHNAGYNILVVKDAIIYHDNEEILPGGKRREYLYHFMSDDRRFYVFARNRIIFHSLYSTRLELLSILLVWMWVFTLYYLYKIFSYNGVGNFPLSKRVHLALQYLKGDIEGLLFVIKGEKLHYS